MRTRKAIAISGVMIWLLALGFVSGPVRWEFAHTYAHWIEGAESDLPALTRAVALPVLGLGDAGFGAFSKWLLFWGALWLGAAAMLWLVWRARSRELLVEALTLCMVMYAPLVFLLFAVLATGLWLPFSLL